MPAIFVYYICPQCMHMNCQHIVTPNSSIWQLGQWPCTNYDAVATHVMSVFHVQGSLWVNNNKLDFQNTCEMNSNTQCTLRTASLNEVNVDFWCPTGHKQHSPWSKSCVVWPIFTPQPPPCADFLALHTTSQDFNNTSKHNTSGCDHANGGTYSIFRRIKVIAAQLENTSMLHW